MKRLRTFDRRRIEDVVRRQLTHQPLVETLNRFPMEPNSLAEWELWVDPFRLLYDVEGDVVRVKVVARKVGALLYEDGKELDTLRKSMQRPLNGGGAHLVVPGTDVVVPLADSERPAAAARTEEARTTAKDAQIRALLVEADRDFAAGLGVAAEDLRRELGIDEPSYDPETDTLHVPLGDGPYAYAVELDDRRTVAYAEDGSAFGVEVRRASEGVVLAGLPEAERIAAEARRHGLPVKASSESVVAS